MTNTILSEYGEDATKTREMRERRLDLLLPESFDALAVLPPSLRRYADEVRYFVNLVVRKTVSGKADRKGFVRLYSKPLREIIDNRRVSDMTEALVMAGIVERAPYSVGVESFGYRLAERLLSERCMRWRPTYKFMRRKMERFIDQFDRNEDHTLLPIHKALRESQAQLTIKSVLAEQIWRTLTPEAKLGQSIFIGNIRCGCPAFTLSKTGRVANGITSLKRVLRPTLRIDSQRLGNVDLCCAQPAILGLLLQKPDAICTTYVGYYPVVNDYVELGKYVRLACHEDLYEHLADKCGLPREQVKRRFLADVLAKKWNYPSQVEDVFRDEFPRIHAYIKAYNASDHGKLIRQLQRLEAWLVIEQVAPKLVNRIPIVTLHDALYCRASDVSTVETAFYDTFAELGFEIRLKTEVTTADGDRSNGI